jgi:hypothetical protein
VTVRDALVRREAGRWDVYSWYDESVLEIEAAAGWRAPNGGHPAPAWAREKRQIAWDRYARAHLQRRQHDKIAERDALSKLALEQMTATLAARQARRDSLLVELVALDDIEAAETELQSTDHVTPLGERGPPTVREISSDRGHGYAPTRKDLTGCRKLTIVPTGRSGGDG